MPGKRTYSPLILSLWIWDNKLTCECLFFKKDRRGTLFLPDLRYEIRMDDDINDR